MLATRRSDALVALEAELTELRGALLAAEAARSPEIRATHPSHHRSAVNLVHYVELRTHDIRDLQSRLRMLGLSSLGRSEPNVLGTVEAVLTILARLNGHGDATPDTNVALDEGDDLLAGNADRLLGPALATRSTRIMVTLPSEAGDAAPLVAELFDRGMDIARVNCAHDDTTAWVRMIDYVRSSASNGRRCRVAMDLGGPKLRTGPLEDGPRVVRVAPKRDQSGCVVTPARVLLIAGGTGRNEVTADSITEVPVEDAAWVARRRPGDELKLRDSRGSRRSWKILETFPGGCLASTEKTTYVMTGLQLSCRTADGEDAVVIGELPTTEQFHRVHRGDQVVLTRSLVPAAPTLAGVAHHIGCSLSAAFQHARPGERVWLDDGKIGGTIDRVDDDEIVVTVTDVRPRGAKLKAAKGITCPTPTCTSKQ